MNRCLFWRASDRVWGLRHSHGHRLYILASYNEEKWTTNPNLLDFLQRHPECASFVCPTASNLEKGSEDASMQLFSKKSVCSAQPNNQQICLYYFLLFSFVQRSRNRFPPAQSTQKVWRQIIHDMLWTSMVLRAKNVSCAHCIMLFLFYSQHPSAHHHSPLLRHPSCKVLLTQGHDLAQRGRNHYRERVWPKIPWTSPWPSWTEASRQIP